MRYNPPALLDRLSPRERQVLDLTLRGSTLREMATVMGVSSSTIDIYRNRIMVKLDIYDLAGLVRFARRYVVVASTATAA
jgi:FixJ family two-component response regulator